MDKVYYRVDSLLKFVSNKSKLDNNSQTNGQTNRQTNGQTNGQTDKQTYERMDRQMMNTELT